MKTCCMPNCGPFSAMAAESRRCSALAPSPGERGNKTYGDEDPAMSKHAKILIVDDEPFNVDYLEQELEDFGYDTISATNGQEALAQVAAENPDLILLDVMMPLMDGFTVCRILKEHEDTRLIPIVMMTALGEIEDRIKGI